MTTVRITTLERIDELTILDPLLQDYVTFICDDLERHAGVRFDAEELIAKTRATLPRVVPPEGRTFVAMGAGERPVGMVFLRVSGAEAMEIKRLYMRPETRGQGTGRALVEAAIAEARASGARFLRLDTSANLTEAIALYRRLGFVDRAPYAESDHFEDPVLGPHLVFMEKAL